VFEIDPQGDDQMAVEQFEKLYESRTPECKALFDEASKILPGGVGGNGKFMQPYPLYVEKAYGGYVWDVDGNQYIDMLMGAGVHILGHHPEPVVDALAQQIQQSIHLYIPALPEVRLAQKINHLMPHVEMVRFINSGSEATMMVLRVARAYSGRDKIARFEGNYHGQHNYALVSTLTTAGELKQPQPSMDSAGIPKAVAEKVLVLPYNDAENATRIIEENADELGAVIIEAFSAFGLGCIPADPEFLQAVREVTIKHGIPLIFDEVVTNFRLGLGGATEYFGVTPDLVAMGKILSGGVTMAAYGGKREIMEKAVTPTAGLWDLTEQIFQSGTFSGNPLSTTAGLAVLEELEKGEALPYLDGISDTLREGWQDLAKNTDLKMLVTGVKSIFQVHFGVDEIKNKRDLLSVDKATTREFHMGLIANGVLASAHPLFLSSAHSEQDVDRILDVSKDVLSKMGG
jgi:glutamate-1-semialdehyde 2,1-aminomutase